MNGLLQRARAASQLPLRDADLERQAREFGHCVCGLPVVLHYAGRGTSGAWLGCEVARILETCAARLSAMSHAAQCAATSAGRHHTFGGVVR